jgi:hypothetical protein
LRLNHQHDEFTRWIRTQDIVNNRVTYYENR